MAPSASPPLPLSRRDLPRALDCLARAFDADPALRCLFPKKNPGAADRVRRFLESHLRHAMCHGEVHLTSARCEGVAVWLPSARASLSTLAALRAGDLWELARLGPATILRMLLLDHYMGGLHRELMPGPHRVLSLVGVDPVHQGAGWAGRLLRPALARTRDRGQPCYVDTNVRRNVGLYEHLGFELRGHRRIPGTGVQVWGLVRSPGR